MKDMYSVYSHLPRVVTISKSNHLIKGKEKVRGYTSFAFKPGENFIPVEIFKIIKEVPLFQELVSLGIKGFDAPENLGETVEVGKPEEIGFKIAALRDLERTKLIKKINGEAGREGVLDVEVLHLLRKEEDRATVLRAIDGQLKKLGVKV